MASKETAQPDPGQFFERMVADQQWDTAVNTHETSRRVDMIFGRLLAPVPLAGRRLLDAGSGGGHFSAAAAARRAKVYSLDVGPNLLAQVSRRCQSRKMIGSIAALPLRNESFDIVLSTEVIEHTPDPLACLAELSRAVRVGGHLVITTPSRLWQSVVRGATRLKLRPYEGFENFIWPRHAHHLLERQGLRVEEVLGFNLLPLFNKRFERLHRFADRLGHMFPAAFVNFGLRARRMWSFGVDPGVPEEDD